MAKKFSELRAKMSPERQRGVEERVRAMLAEMPLHEVRRARARSKRWARSSE